MKAVAAAVVPVVARVADKHAPKAAQVAHAMARHPHVVGVLRKATAAIVKIVLKEVLMARHQTVSTTATMTDATTVAPVATNCHVTSIPS